MVSPLDWLVRRLFRAPLAVFDAAPWPETRALLERHEFEALASYRHDAYSIGLTIPRQHRRRIPRVSLRPKRPRRPKSSRHRPSVASVASVARQLWAENRWRDYAGLPSLEAMTADPSPNPVLLERFEWSDFDGGRRPDTKEGREGR